MAGVTPTTRRVLIALWIATRIVASAVLFAVVMFGTLMFSSRRRY